MSPALSTVSHDSPVTSTCIANCSTTSPHHHHQHPHHSLEQIHPSLPPKGHHKQVFRSTTHTTIHRVMHHHHTVLTSTTSCSTLESGVMTDSSSTHSMSPPPPPPPPPLRSSMMMDRSGSSVPNVDAPFPPPPPGALMSAGSKSPSSSSRLELHHALEIEVDEGIGGDRDSTSSVTSSCGHPECPSSAPAPTAPAVVPASSGGGDGEHNGHHLKHREERSCSLNPSIIRPPLPPKSNPGRKFTTASSFPAFSTSSSTSTTSSSPSSQSSTSSGGGCSPPPPLPRKKKVTPPLMMHHPSLTQAMAMATTSEPVVSGPPPLPPKTITGRKVSTLHSQLSMGQLMPPTSASSLQVSTSTVRRFSHDSRVNWFPGSINGPSPLASSPPSSEDPMPCQVCNQQQQINNRSPTSSHPQLQSQPQVNLAMTHHNTMTRGLPHPLQTSPIHHPDQHVHQHHPHLPPVMHPCMMHGCPSSSVPTENHIPMTYTMGHQHHPVVTAITTCPSVNSMSSSSLPSNQGHRVYGTHGHKLLHQSSVGSLLQSSPHQLPPSCSRASFSVAPNTNPFHQLVTSTSPSTSALHQQQHPLIYTHHSPTSPQHQHHHHHPQLMTTSSSPIVITTCSSCFPTGHHGSSPMSSSGSSSTMGSNSSLQQLVSCTNAICSDPNLLHQMPQSDHQKHLAPIRSLDQVYQSNLLLHEWDVTQYLTFKGPDEDGPDIKGGPGDVLLVKATEVTKNDFLFQEAFLATYRTFMTPKELIDKLLFRYNRFQPDPDRKQKAATNVFSLLVRVVGDLCVSDCTEDVMSVVLSFVYQLTAQGDMALARALRDKAVEKIETRRLLLDQLRVHLPSVAISTKLSSLLDFKSEDLAEQMTLLDSDLFARVEVAEALLWSKDQQNDVIPNLSSFTTHFNNMSYWIRTRILQEEEPKGRERLLIKFIKVMKNLRKLNNFHAIFAMMSALDSAPVRRLDWPRSVTEGIKEFAPLVDSSSSFRSYRQVLADTDPPCIPYIGLILSDLTFVHVGNESLLPNGDVNFSKNWLQFDILDQMRKFRNSHYPFIRNEDIVSYFNNFDDYLHEESLWQISESIKPRGKK